MTAVTPHRTRLVRRAVGLGLVGMVAVTGCTGGGATPPASSTTAPPSTTAGTTSAGTTSTTAPPSTSTTPPTTPTADPVIARIPAAARENTPTGSEAFARFYVFRLNAAWTTADASLLAGLSQDDCKTCTAFIDTAKRFQRDGLRHDRATLKVTNATAGSFADKRAIVNIFVDQIGVRVIDQSGRTVDKTTSGRGALVATMRYQDDHWVLERLQTAKS